MNWEWSDLFALSETILPLASALAIIIPLRIHKSDPFSIYLSI